MRVVAGLAMGHAQRVLLERAVLPGAY